MINRIRRIHAQLKVLVNDIDAQQDSIANKLFVAGPTMTSKFEGFFYIMIALNTMTIPNR